MINPILERELKTRMRTWKTSILLTVFLLIIGGILTLFFVGNSAASSFGAYGFDPSIISTIYDFLAVTMMVMLIIIIPVFTATAISGERERQTLDLMLCSDFSPWKIVFGKMSAALSFVLLMIMTAMPFMAITLLFGGISIVDILKLVVYYMAASIMLSSIGMFTTTHFKKNVTSILMSYLLLGAMMLIPVFILLIITISESYMYINNAAGSMSMMDKYGYEILVVLFGPNPVFGISSLVNNDMFDLNYLFNQSSSFIRQIEPWIISAVYFLVISSFFVLLSKRKLGKVK